MKKELINSWRLYLITDYLNHSESKVEAAINKALEYGADVVQLRHKTASKMKMLRLAKRLMRICDNHGKPLMINDYADVCADAHASGVHLGQEDMSLAEAKALAGSDCIYGRSTHSSEQILKAYAEGFDYIGVGPVFPTTTKPDYAPVGLSLVSYAAKKSKVPFVAIGSIDHDNVDQVRSSGASIVAVVRDLMREGDLRERIRKLKGGSL